MLRRGRRGRGHNKNMETKSDADFDDAEPNAPQDFKVSHKVVNYRIIHVPLGSVTHNDVPPQGAQPPRYDRERDEPIFVKVWERAILKHDVHCAMEARLAATRADERMSNRFPPPPPEGFKLRGPRNRRSIGAKQRDLEKTRDAGEKQ